MKNASNIVLYVPIFNTIQNTKITFYEYWVEHFSLSKVCLIYIKFRLSHPLDKKIRAFGQNHHIYFKIAANFREMVVIKPIP